MNTTLYGTKGREEGRLGKQHTCFIYALASAKTTGTEGMDPFSRKTLTWLNIMFFQVVRHRLAGLSHSGLSIWLGRVHPCGAALRILFKVHPGSAVVGRLVRAMCSVLEVCFHVNSSFQKDFPLSLFNVCLWDHPVLELEGPQCHHCQNSPGNK